MIECVAAGDSVRNEAEEFALRALIRTLDEAPEFDSDHIGGMIAFAVQRARTARDQAEALRAACWRTH